MDSTNADLAENPFLFSLKKHAAALLRPLPATRDLKSMKKSLSSEIERMWLKARKHTREAVAGVATAVVGLLLLGPHLAFIGVLGVGGALLGTGVSRIQQRRETKLFEYRVASMA